VTVQGKTVLITGAGSGIGRAMAELMADNGARVVVCDRDSDRVEATVTTILAAGGVAAGVAGDVTRTVDVDRFVAAAIGLGGRIDVLCNNAGIMDGRLGVHEMDEELWNRVLAVNLTGPYLMARRVIPLMLDQHAGVIINTASVAGLRGGRAGAAYTASKFGVVGLTQSIAAFYGRDGIRCNAICPGSVATNIVADSGELSALGSRIFEAVGYRPPQAQPSEIAHVALFLASNEAGYVNGATVVVDGGLISF
jgi:NAD(P)-dependent dehydrogenase (short-subunit alcohol dehydrogenase family)